MKVVFTARARADLREIATWIARDDPARAVSFVIELQRKALSLATGHAHYPAITEAAEHGCIRRLNHGRYRIIYRVRVAAETIDILAVHHGARDYPPLA